MPTSPNKPAVVDEGTRRILLIDDNPNIHADYRKVLDNSFGVRSEEVFHEFLGTPQPQLAEMPPLIIDSAMQGEEGLAKVKQSIADRAPYAMAFVDVRMPPGWDGIKTIEEIWKVAPDLQVVICSAYSDYSWQDIRRRFDRTDNLLILKKPFEAIEVIQLACTLTEKWILTNKARLRQEDLQALVEHRTRQLEYASLHDSLTGLANRNLFGDRLQRALTSRRQSVTGVVMIDIDHFKHINDSWGHITGDKVLKTFAKRLRSVVRNTDTVARLGGDEFAVILHDLDHAKQAHKLLERIYSTLSQPIVVEQETIDCGFSGGVALAPDDGNTAQLLLTRSDLALNKSKNEGRRTLTFYDASMEAELRKNQLLSTDLERAIRNDEFDLYFQPIVAMDDHRVVSFESLIRWNHPRRGIVPPSDFITLAEDNGLIVEIGRWVIESACNTAANWPDHISVAVNVSAVQFRNRYRLVEVVEGALLTSGLEPNRLEIEITESILLQESIDTMDQLHAIRDLGVSVALDDFGTGYSSLAYLRSFPFDRLKIDRSFVSSSIDNKEAIAIRHAVADLGRNLGMKTTAEGVETLAELECVQREGFTHVQGYYFGRPTPPGNLGPFLEPAIPQLA